MTPPTIINKKNIQDKEIQTTAVLLLANIARNPPKKRTVEEKIRRFPTNLVNFSSLSFAFSSFEAVLYPAMRLLSLKTLIIMPNNNVSDPPNKLAMAIPIKSTPNV